MQMKVRTMRSTGWVSAVFLAALISTLLTCQPFLRTAMGAQQRLLSLNARAEPLGDVLEKISNDTGYRITVDSEWTGLPVSGNFKNLPIDQGLRRILSKLNHSIVFNDADQRISIIIKSFLHGEEFPIKVVGKAGNDSLPAVLQLKTVSQKHFNNADDIQVIPPKGSGDTGITQKQLEEIEARRPEVDPDSIEVIPPKKPGEAGILRKQLKETESGRIKLEPDDIEVIPPSESAGKGVTVKEIKAQQVPQQTGGIKDTNPVPPDSLKRN